MTDTVADLLIRIKNAYMAKHPEVVMPATKLRENILKVLVETGYIAEFSREEKQPQDELKVRLRYVGGRPAMTNMKRVSKPGRRLYGTVDVLPRVLGGHGISVISTSQGIMTDKMAREKKVGGEILFTMW